MITRQHSSAFVSIRQLEVVESAGGRPIMMASLALCACSGTSHDEAPCIADAVMQRDRD
jgi:hypothetical protein